MVRNPRQHVRLLFVVVIVALFATACFTVTTPGIDGETVSLPVDFSGEADHPDGITSVKLWIKDMDTNLYWNPTTAAWQAGWIEFDAVVETPGASETVWSYEWDPTGTGGSGNYRLRGAEYHFGEKGEEVTRFFTTSSTTVFFDDFDGTALDTSKWKIVTGAYGVPSGSDPHYRDQCYTASPDNVRVGGGALTLEAHRSTDHGCAEPTSGDPVGFTSGMVVSNDTALPAASSTRGNLAFNQGTISMRARLDDAPGFWPAFWMRPKDSAYGSWPLSGEIDIMEYPGSTPASFASDYATHAGIFYHDGQTQHDHDELVVGTGSVEDWHIYRLEWDEAGFTFFFDDDVVAVTPFGAGQAPFDEDFFLTLNLQVDGWAGTPLASANTADIEIDWVRVTQD